MTKRNWPDFRKLCKDYLDRSLFFEDWLEANIPKEVLDKIAPPICEAHEPLTDPIDPTYFVYYPVPRCKHCGAEIKPERWVLK